MSNHISYVIRIIHQVTHFPMQVNTPLVCFFKIICLFIESETGKCTFLPSGVPQDPRATLFTNSYLPEVAQLLEATGCTCP